MEKNQTLVTIEAMKMETAITARMDGTVASIEIKEGDTVKGGQLLLTGDMTAEDVMASVQTAAAALK